MKTKSIIFTLLTLIHVSGWSSDKIVKIATLTGYPPFCFDEPAGTASVSNSIPPGMDAKSFKGISWDVVRESFAAVDYTIQLELVPWVRVMNYLENNQVDLCFPAVKTDGRGELYYFSKNPVDRQQFVIYVRKDSPLQWDGLKSLSGLTIGTMREWSFGQRFETADFFKKVSNTEIIIGLQNLNLGRVDGVVGYEISYDYELTKAGMLNVFKNSSSLSDNAPCKSFPNSFTTDANIEVFF